MAAPDSHDKHDRVAVGRRAMAGLAWSEAITMGLYISIVLLTLLVGFSGDGERAEEVRLLWGTALGLVLAHYFALRLSAVFARAKPLPTKQDAVEGGAQVAAAVAVTGIATLPYLADISTLDASTASSVLLLGVIGATAFTSVRRAGGVVSRAVAFTAIVVLVASVVVAIKYNLAH